ncbi:hypothetical protein C8J57DRAFT_1254071 [Mycena rebaudengoi]|nr:hypothetical protein C8J57DRAFT_1254071 [Mycena rebaudengoi]
MCAGRSSRPAGSITSDPNVNGHSPLKTRHFERYGKSAGLGRNSRRVILRADDEKSQKTNLSAGKIPGLNELRSNIRTKEEDQCCRGVFRMVEDTRPKLLQLSSPAMNRAKIDDNSEKSTFIDNGKPSYVFCSARAFQREYAAHDPLALEGDGYSLGVTGFELNDSSGARAASPTSHLEPSASSSSVPGWSVPQDEAHPCQKRDKVGVQIRIPYRVATSQLQILQSRKSEEAQNVRISGRVVKGKRIQGREAQGHFPETRLFLLAGEVANRKTAKHSGTEIKVAVNFRNPLKVEVAEKRSIAEERNRRVRRVLVEGSKGEVPEEGKRLDGAQERLSRP